MYIYIYVILSFSKDKQFNDSGNGSKRTMLGHRCQTGWNVHAKLTYHLVFRAHILVCSEDIDDQAEFLSEFCKGGKSGFVQF